MAAVQSTMQALGSAAPHFDLPNVIKPDAQEPQKSQISSTDFSGQAMLVMFICNHCPFVVHIAECIAALANKAQDQGFGVVAINSNDTQAYPQDGAGPMASFAEQYGFNFPYLLDESQQVAKAFSAACTPDFFIYDSNHYLQYRGQFDGSRPGNDMPVTGEELQGALSAVLAGRSTDDNQVPSIGCNIKWRLGNEPDYF